MKMSKEAQVAGVVGLGVIILAILIYLVIRNNAKKSGEAAYKPYQAPVEADDNNWSPTPLAESLHDAMSGFAWTETKVQAWTPLLPGNLSDAQVKEVYNEFNNRYGTEKDWFGTPYGTLTAWIRNESGDFGGTQDKVISRLMGLNLP